MLERIVERTLYGSRWLLAPIYLGLTLTLMVIAVKFFQEIFHIFPVILATAEQDLVLTVLSLIDLSLVASLVVMVMFAGYENFVSRINLDETHEKLDWLGKYDSGTLKLKVAASIVAISSIHLLRIFVQIPGIDNEKLKWYVIIHMTFVVSAIGMGYLEKMGHHKP